MSRKLLESLSFIGRSVPLIALRFADGSGDPKPADPPKADSKLADPPADPAEEKKFTQADIDDAVEKRLARERKKWEREQQKQQQPPAPPAGAGDGNPPAQQIQQPQQPPKDDSAEKIAKANQRLVAAEARAAAIAAGAKPDRVDYVVRLTDLSKVDVDEDDGPDTDAIKKAIDKVLKDMPEFKSTPDSNNNGGSGFQIGADGSKQGGGYQQTRQVQTTPPTATKRWNKFR